MAVEGFNENQRILIESTIGGAYYVGGRSKEAKELFRQWLALSKSVLGKKHPDTLTSMANLASIY